MGHWETQKVWVEDDEDDLDDYEYDEEQAYLDDLAEVQDCRCGAKRIGSNGRLAYVADCCC